MTDGKQARVSSLFTLTVAAALTFSTSSPLPAGVDGAPYSQSIVVAGGTAPYVFTLSGASPPGLTISKTGVVSGTPTSIGTFTFTIKVTDNFEFSIQTQYSITIAPAAPLLQVSPLALTFNAVSGGDTPPPQTIAIVSANASAVNFATAIDAGTQGSAQPPWITIAPASGATPTLLIVSVNPAMLQNSTGNEVIHITVPQNSAQVSIDVRVTLNILAAVSQLHAAPKALHFSASVNAAAIQQQTLLITNSGSAQNFTATVAGNSPWLSITTPTGSAGSTATGGVIQAQIDSQGLAVGYYHDIVQITGAGTIDVPVSLFVASGGPISGLAVRARVSRPNKGADRRGRKPSRF